LSKIEYQYQVEKSQYRNVSNNKLRNQYSRRYKFIKVESYYFDEAAHDAISVAYESSSIVVDDHFYIAKDTYQVETNLSMNKNKGSINLFEQENFNYGGYVPPEPVQKVYNYGGFETIDYGQTEIVIPHGLIDEPTYFRINPVNEAAINLSYFEITVDATNITFKPVFTNNDSQILIYTWEARV